MTVVQAEIINKPLYHCVRVWVGACTRVGMLQSLRYPLLLSIGAMGLVVPRGHRWHQNPQSHSEKVTKIHKSHPPPVLLHPFAAGNTLLRLGPAWAFSPPINSLKATLSFF